MSLIIPRNNHNLAAGHLTGMGRSNSASLIKAIRVTIADLEDRFSPEDPSVTKLKGILWERVTDLERDDVLEFPNAADLNLRAL